MKFREAVRIIFAALLLAISSSAAAHPFHPIDTGFGAGFAHPFFGLDHLLAMVAVGLWAAQSGDSRLWTIPLTFLAAMLAGGKWGHAGLTLPLLEPMIAASALILGLLVTLRVRLQSAGIALIALFALFHGLAHGAEMPSAAIPLHYAAGFTLATGLLHMLGLVAGLRMHSTVRWAGAPIALAGCWMMVGTVI